MRNPKIVDGKIEYRYKTFDGSYVAGTASASQFETMLKDAKEDDTLPGFELVNGDYHFATEQIVMKFKKAPKGDQ